MASTTKSPNTGPASGPPTVAAPRPTSRYHDPEALMPNWVRTTLLALITLFIAMPLLYILMSSVAADSDVANGKLWPTNWNFDNYAKIWTTVGLARGLANSVIVAGVTAFVGAMFAVATAYVLVRYDFRGRLTILRALVGLQSIPAMLLLLPIFVLFSSLATYTGVNLVGTRFGLFVTYLTFALPFSTWVMVTYIRGLPRELEEAAAIDGASPFGILTRIIMPLSWPGIVVAAIFAFLLGWNDVLFASIMTTPETETAAVALQVFGSTAEGGALPVYGQMMAAALVSGIPIVVLYLFFQRYLVSGLTAGGVK